MVEHKGALYVFGGGRSDVACDLICLPTFVLSGKVWTSTQTRPDPQKGTFPQPRRCHVASKVNNCKCFIVFDPIFHCYEIWLTYFRCKD